MKTERFKREYPLPDDFGSCLAAYHYGAHSRSISVISTAEMEQMVSSSTPNTLTPCGIPIYAAFTDTQMLLFPCPDDVYKITVRYTKAPPVRVW